jgi:hypothetical protein
MHISKSKLRQLIQEELENAENYSEEDERIAELLIQMKALGYSEEDLLRIWRGEKSAAYETQGI